MEVELIKLLLVDDDEDDYYLTSSYIKDIPHKKFTITWATSFSKAVQLLTEESFDICFFDFLLGAQTGIDLLKIVLAKGIDTPVVLLTGKGDLRVDVEAMQLGAMDYLVKSKLSTESIERCIRYSLERAATIRTIKENEVRLKRIFELMKDAILLKYPQGRIFYYNTATLKLLGFNTDDIKQLTIKDLFSYPEEYLNYLAILNNHDAIENLEIWLKRKNGEKIQCSLNLYKQRDSKNNPYFMLVIQDITSRKKVEREKLMIEKAASSARLVRALAHEVRNPLTNINLSLDQLEPELGDEDLRFFTDIIRRNSIRINVLISELLNSFKPQETVFHSSSINQLINDVIEEAIDRIELKKIELIKSLQADCLLYLDYSKIKIALLNLIINAVEAMEAHIGILKIITVHSTENLILKIEDNGTGISPQNINKLFEPFFTSKPNGVGLGLTATWTILQSHQATVEVESELNKGTTFTISFPKLLGSQEMLNLME